MRKILLFIFCAFLVFGLFGCGEFAPSKSVKIDDVEPIKVGETLTLKVTLKGLEGSIKFASSDEKVLTVDELGQVVAISEGTAKVSATVKDIDQTYSDEVEITVIAKDPSSHTHEACLECGKCTSDECDGQDSEKCLGHTDTPTHDCNLFKSDWQNVDGALCGDKVPQQIICTECEKVLEERTIKQEHDYKSEVITEKTCEQNGEIKYTCLNCKYSYTKKDYSLGHEEDEIKIILEATPTTLGTKIIGCKHCDHVFKEFNYVDNAYHKNGKLSVNGADLVNQYGEKVQLYGLSTHGIQWFSKVINFDTICEIQENFGNNIIRFAMYTDENGYCDGSEATKKMMLEALHRGIEIATELGLYVIVDWHMVGAENVLDKNPLTYLEEAKEFFNYITDYYKDQDNILYEIMNEPNGSTTWADCKKYANEIIPIIRKNTDAIVLVGNPKWTADLNSVMKDPLVGYTNIMYTYHFYAADHTSTTQVVKAYDSGFPVFISEFGFMESSGDGNISTTNGEKWKKVLDARNISYVAWNISNSKGSASIFKYNTSKLDDVSDSNLKEWGIYLKNWYRAKSLNMLPGNEDENLQASVELKLEIPEWSTSYECFIISSGDSDSRLDYEWSSTNEAVVTVSSYSSVTIYGDGTCSIICKNKTTGEAGILDIVVKNGKIESWTSRYTE